MSLILLYGTKSTPKTLSLI